MHRDGDEHNTLCKKAVSLSGLGNSQCILRLKRWLIAGVDDGGFPPHRQRSHHVSLGGRGLQDFSEGMDEPELDRRAMELMQAAREGAFWARLPTRRAGCFAVSEISEAKASDFILSQRNLQN